jgi:hypothetical protein
MHIKCACRNKRFRLDLAINRIETDSITNDAEDEPYPTFYRAIRIKTTDGKILVLSLVADEELKLRLQKSTLLTVEAQSVGSDAGDPPVEWLTPQAYTGEAEDEG